MTFFEKLGKVLTKNVGYTIMLVVAFIFFLYFAEGDLIAGLLTALSALVVYICVVFLYQEYQKMPAEKNKSTKKK